MHATPQNIRKLSRDLRNFLGEDFFAERIDTFSIDGLNLRDGYIKEQHAHPLAHLWKTFLNDIAISEQRGTLLLNSDSIICLHTLMYLDDLMEVKNFKRIVDDLKIKEKFYSTLFEARIASEYRSKGYHIEIQDERGLNKGGICDFFITVDDKKIFIECKSLSDLLQNERKLWNELFIRISNMLENKNLSWNIEICLGKEIASSDVEEICSLLQKDINSKTSGNRHLSSGSIIIKKEPINKNDLVNIQKKLLITTDASGDKGQITFDQKRFAHFAKNGLKLTNNMFDIESQGLFITRFKMLKGGVPSSLSAFRVSIFPHADFDLTKRIISNIRKAAKQVPKNEMGIIDIAVPNSIGNQLVLIVDNSYDKILNKLRRNHSRINAVVIYGHFFERNPWGPLLSLHYIIPNMNREKALPKDFEILGVENANIEIPPKKGTVLFEFMMDPMWQQGLTYRIFHHSSHDGSYQLKLLTTASNKIRLEIVTPAIGREYLENEKEINLVPGGHYKFAGRWGEGEISMFIDGNKVGSKDIGI